jgi:hypothetical protein
MTEMRRESELLASISKLQGTSPVDPARVTVLVCPPVSRLRVFAAALAPQWMRRALGLESYYINEYLKYRGTVGHYWTEAGRPVLRIVQLLRRTGTPPVLNARFEDLEKALAARPQVLFLFAHRCGADEIEFAGSRRSWNEVASVIPPPRSGERPCLLLDICDSERWRNALREVFPQMKAAGGTSTMSLLDSLRMVGIFILKCDGTSTFEDAWSRAEYDYWSAS